METFEYPEEVERTRRLIFSTCTALGGYDTITLPDGNYKRIYSVGDEALGCLKDLKRFMRADEQLTRDALIEFNVLESGLIPIMLLYSHMSTPAAERFILACVEIIVPLTWPIPKQPEETNEYQDPNMLLHYREFKQKLLEEGIFEAVLRLCVKSLQIPYRDRSTRDQSIIRLTLYFWRNLTAIADPMVSGISSAQQIVLSKLQERLLIRSHKSNVLELLLTMASTAGTTDSNEWHTTLLEIVYNLLEFADAKDTVSVGGDKSNAAISNKLTTLLESEKLVKRRKTQNAPSRHNRFGGTYTIKGWGGSTLAVTHKQTGGYADLDQLIGLQPKNRAGMKRKQVDEIGTHKSYEDPEALGYLKQFGISFLESCFNTFYASILKNMQREDKSIIQSDYARFYLTQRWFLEFFIYELSARQLKNHQQEKQKQKEANDHLFLPNRQQATGTSNEDQNTGSANDTLPTSSEGSTTAQETMDATSETGNNGSTPDSDFDYDLIANMIDVRMFWASMKRMRLCIEEKRWLDVQVTADCLRLLLVILKSMARSTQPDYQKVADHIQSNIYHEQFALDIFPDLLRTYRNQSFGYIASSLQLISAMLKMLEDYCKTQQVLFVRRNNPRRKSKAKPSSTSADEEMDAGNSDDSQTEEDRARSRQIAHREHVFAFKSFEKRFATYDLVRISCILLEDYENLDSATIFAITRVFHRIMVKNQIEHLFWKLPTLDLFRRILKRSRSATPTSGTKAKAVNELLKFIRYVVAHFFEKARTYPLLYVEALFKIEPCRVAKKNESPPSQ